MEGPPPLYRKKLPLLLTSFFGLALVGLESYLPPPPPLVLLMSVIVGSFPLYETMAPRFSRESFFLLLLALMKLWVGGDDIYSAALFL